MGVSSFYLEFNSFLDLHVCLFPSPSQRSLQPLFSQISFLPLSLTLFLVSVSFHLWSHRFLLFLSSYHQSFSIHFSFLCSDWMSSALSLNSLTFSSLSYSLTNSFYCIFLSSVIPFFSSVISVWYFLPFSILLLKFSLYSYIISSPQYLYNSYFELYQVNHAISISLRLFSSSFIFFFSLENIYVSLLYVLVSMQQTQQPLLPDLYVQPHAGDELYYTILPWFLVVLQHRTFFSVAPCTKWKISIST